MLCYGTIRQLALRCASPHIVGTAFTTPTEPNDFHCFAVTPLLEFGPLESLGFQPSDGKWSSGHVQFSSAGFPGGPFLCIRQSCWGRPERHNG